MIDNTHKTNLMESCTQFLHKSIALLAGAIREFG